MNASVVENQAWITTTIYSHAQMFWSYLYVIWSPSHRLKIISKFATYHRLIGQGLPFIHTHSCRLPHDLPTHADPTLRNISCTRAILAALHSAQVPLISVIALGHSSSLTIPYHTTCMNNGVRNVDIYCAKQRVNLQITSEPHPPFCSLGEAGRQWWLYMHACMMQSSKFSATHTYGWAATSGAAI